MTTKKYNRKRMLNFRRSPAGLIIILSLVLLAACQDPFDLKTVLGLDTGVLSVSPNGAAIADNASQQFTVSGGTTPYTWSMYAGPGSIDAAGLYTPGVIGVATIQVVDLAGLSGKATIAIIDSALILPLNLLAGTTTLETGDSITLFATGGDDPYTFDIPTNISGASITPLGGFYTAGPGAGVDTVRVTDNLGAIVTVNITVTPATIPDVDYRPITINSAIPAVIGGAITADFMYENIGTDSGGTAVSWSAYVSTSTDLSGVVWLADSGTVPELSALTASGAPQAIGGVWPPDGGNYYIVVHLAAEADVNMVNNVAASDEATISVDYHTSALPAGNGVQIGSPLSVEFDLSNQGTVAGASNVVWYAYISTNPGLGAGDTLIDDGNFTGLLGTDAQPQTVTVTDIWPWIPGNYHVILEWVSADDPAGYKEKASGAFTVSF